MRFFALCFCISSCLFNLCPLTSQPVVQTPRCYTARFTSDSVVIDGHAELVWNRASWSEDFIDIAGEKVPKFHTRVKMLWDQDYLYFFAELEEPHVWADIRTRDAVIFYNNDFEVFIDPDGDTHNYLELEMNALNSVWDLWLTKPYRSNGKVNDGWDLHGLKTAVKVWGTLNDPSDTDSLWTVEIAMPWKALTEAGAEGRVPAGKFWRINFSRVNWDHDLINDEYVRRKGAEGHFLPEYNWVWSPQGVVNMHEPERWGYVYFATGDQESFTPDLNEELKWALYTLYRELRLQLDAGKTPRKPTIVMNGQKILVRLDQHLTGWNLSVTSPLDGKVLIVKEDSEFIIK